MEFILAFRKVTVIIILNQDDFLPRTATPLEDIFKSLFWYGSGLMALYGVNSFYVGDNAVCKVVIAPNMAIRALFLQCELILMLKFIA